MVEHCTEYFRRHKCLVIMALLLSLATVAMVQAVQTINSKSYRGAVVEYTAYKINSNETPESTILRNAQAYIGIIAAAATANVDIIVFPEYGLTGWDITPGADSPNVTSDLIREKLKLACTFIPDAEDNSIPCNEKQGEIAEHLRELSCAARDNQIYLVINLGEKESCDTATDGCPDDGLYFYNSNIIFDRDGKIIAKYHKQNLFAEPEFNVSKEMVTFDTDFGVTFGTFICFDMMFPVPATRIVEEKKVKNIVYTTAWVAELPMLTAAQAQAGYSYSLNVNFLASGLNYPGGGSAGSGIYSGKNGPLVVAMPEEETIKLLIADIPINPDIHTPISLPYCSEETNQCSSTKTKILTLNRQGLDPENKLSISKEDLTNYDNNLLEELLDLNDLKHESERIEEDHQKTKFSYKSDDGFECEIEVKWEKNPKEIKEKPAYRLFGYSGLRGISNIISGLKIEACFLVACPDDRFESCGLKPTFSNGTNIQSVNIKAISLDLNTIPYAMTVDENLLPLLGNEVSFSNFIKKDSTVQVAYMYLEKPRTNIVSFGTYKNRWSN